MTDHGGLAALDVMDALLDVVIPDEQERQVVRQDAAHLQSVATDDEGWRDAYLLMFLRCRYGSVGERTAIRAWLSSRGWDEADDEDESA